MADSPARGDNHSESLSVSTAASLLEGFLPDDGESQAEEEQPEGAEQDQPEGEESEEAEQEEATEEDPKTEDEDPEDEPEDEPEAPAEPKKHKVKSGPNGEEEEVTEEELKNGYQRRQDYTRKTQATADERRKVDAEKVEVTTAREQYALKLKAMDEALQAATPPTPDWEKLRKEMPADKLAVAYMEWQEHEKRLKIVADERQKAEAQVTQDRKEKLSAYVREEQEKLIESVPEWKDPAKHRAGMAKLAKYAIEVAGFTRDELQTVTDHRVIKLLRTAQAAHELKSKRPDPKKQAERPDTKVTPPTGGDPSKRQVSKATRALQAHAKSRSVRSAASAIEAMLSD